MSLEYSGSVKGWVVQHLAKNHWKIKELMTFEDALQEAGYVFYLMKSRYEKRNEVHTDRQAMAIFMVFWKRYFIDLTKKNDLTKKCLTLSQIKNEAEYYSSFEEALFGVGESEVHNLVLMNTQLQKDQELAKLVDFLANVDEEDLSELRKHVVFGLKRPDSKGNCYLCEKLGITTKRNLLVELKTLLQG